MYSLSAGRFFERFLLRAHGRQAFFLPPQNSMAYRNILTILSALIVGVFCGWLIGSRQEVQINEVVRYVPQSTIHIDSELFPKPTKVENIELPRLQYTDTVREEVCIPADTAGIVADYFKRRAYDLDFSTDTTGIYKVHAVIVCNRLESASATIVPLQREVENTVVKVRKFRPFAEVGVAIGDKVGASLGLGGIIKEKHIISAKYMRIGNNNYYGGEYGYIIGK